MATFRLAAVLSTTLLLPTWASAQDVPQPPARNGNVYDGTAHQPSANTAAREQAAGLAPPAGEREQVQQLGRQALDRAQQGSGADCPPATSGACPAR